jgi:hypothetical protein
LNAGSALRALSPGFLSGVRVGGWWSLLRDNRFDVDARYLPRAAVITACALLNSAIAPLERMLHGRAIEQAEILPPLFVLGLARSGTTLLQELLALDDRLATPNLLQVRFPHVFLTTEGLVTRLSASVMPATRSQDDVPFGWSRPGEEGGALGAMAGATATLGAVFPRRRTHYDRFASLEHVSDAARAAWRDALVHLLRKLTVRYRRPVVLKTPQNTARVARLAALFPRARFVYIHRHPFEVARSQVAMRDVVAPHRRLQCGESDRSGHFVPVVADRARRAVTEMRALPADRLARVRYDELTADPVRTMRSVYERLSLPGFEAVAPRIARHATPARGYRRNVHPALPDALRDRVAREWAVLFEDGGYALSEDDSVEPSPRSNKRPI